MILSPLELTVDFGVLPIEVDQKQSIMLHYAYSN